MEHMHPMLMYLSEFTFQQVGLFIVLVLQMNGSAPLWR